jgi:hypothetical protein
MANKTKDRLLSVFSQAAGNTRGGGAISPPANQDRSHAESVTGLGGGPAGAATFNPASDSGPGPSSPGVSGSRSSTSAGSSGGNGVGSAAASLFGGALGLVPLAATLYGLFDSKSTPAPVFQKYQMPSPVSFEAATSGSGLANSDYGQMGLPRLFDSSETAASSGAGGSTAPAMSGSPAGVTSGASGSSAASATPQINVNVQAMDAQSFMSYSGEIAKAVRDAMLNLSSINDVVSEL